MQRVTYQPNEVDQTFVDVLPDNQRAVIRAQNALQAVAGNPATTTSELLETAALFLEVAHLRGNSDWVTTLHQAAYKQAHEGAFINDD